MYVLCNESAFLKVLLLNECFQELFWEQHRLFFCLWYKKQAIHSIVVRNVHRCVKKNRHRIRWMVVGSLEAPEWIIATTAELSQQQRIVQPFQLCPYTATDTTMGSNSLTVMCTDYHSAPTDTKTTRHRP